MDRTQTRWFFVVITFGLNRCLDCFIKISTSLTNSEGHSTQFGSTSSNPVVYQPFPKLRESISTKLLYARDMYLDDMVERIQAMNQILSHKQSAIGYYHGKRNKIYIGAWITPRQDRRIELQVKIYVESIFDQVYTYLLSSTLKRARSLPFTYNSRSFKIESGSWEK